MISLVLMGQDDQVIFERDIKKAKETPRIEIKYEIILSIPMKKALKQYAPDFRVLPAENLYPGLLTDYKFTNDRAKETLRIHQCPSAVIGDFNGDNKPDIVMKGYDKTHFVFVTLLSRKNIYEVIISTKDEYNKLPENFNPYEPANHIIYMELVEKGKIINSEFEKEPLNLKNDAYKIIGEKTSSITYYKDGKFLSYTTFD